MTNLDEKIFDTGLAGIVEPTHEVVWSQNRRHVLIHGNTIGDRAYVKADLVFADPPAVTFGEGAEYAAQFFSRFAEWVDLNTNVNAAVVLVYRERKGSGILKSVLGTHEFLMRGWQSVREYVWRYSDAEFHRSRPCFSLVHVLRRGDMPMQDCDFRWKDIITLAAPKDSNQDKMIMEMPLDLPLGFIQLFYHPGKFTVLDPFAGTAVVARTVSRMIVQPFSVSFELNRRQFESLRDDIWPTIGG